MRLRPSLDCSRRKRVEGSTSSRPMSATAMLALEALSVSKAAPICNCVFLFAGLVADELSSRASESSTLQPMLALDGLESRSERTSAIVMAANARVADANLGAQTFEALNFHQEEC